MVLPRVEYAVVDEVKLRDYLLSHEHPVGRFKAAFFEALGYGRGDCARLRRDLLALCETHEATERPVSPFGRKFEVRGTLNGPGGRTADVVTVWVVLDGEDIPRFVTAYPA